MEIHQFKSLVNQINDLSYAQLKKLRNSVEDRISSDSVGQVIAEKEDDTFICSHCDSVDISRWGRTRQGVQRFRCKACRKTFNALANTGMYRMRRPDKWIKYTEMMWDGISFRESAARLDINFRTAFRWRHAFLKLPTNRAIKELSGIVEADETFVKESFKGSRKINRAARKRGGGQCKLTPIVIALNRSGDITERVLKRNTKEEIQGFIKPLLTDGSVLCTDGNLSYKGLDEDLNILHKRLVASDNQRVEDGIYHIQTLNNYIMNWKSWLIKFRGVSTKYLPHYLGWYRFMLQNDQLEQTWIRSSV